VTASRRGLLTALGAASVAAPTLAASSPDAELIRLCGDYIEAVRAFNAYDGPLDIDQNPFGPAADAIEAQLEELEPTTLAGVAALARVAIETGDQPAGYFCVNAAAPWLESVMRGVLRLAGEEA